MGTLIVRKLLLWMPFLFGIGFIAPLTSQTLVYWDIAAPFGLTPIGFGLLFGGAWGLYANIKGRWI